MKTVQDEKTPAFMSFDAIPHGLRGLGGFKVLKRKFVDGENRVQGFFYLVQRHAGSLLIMWMLKLQPI